MKKYARFKKFVVHATIVFFMAQMVFPVAVLSHPRAQGAPSLQGSASHAMFDSHMAVEKQVLILDFLQYIEGSAPYREELWKISEGLQEVLDGDRFWFTLGITDGEYSELVVEANSARKYLTEDTYQMEFRLREEQRRLERRLTSDRQAIAASGVVPDGFTDRNRLLAHLYDLQDELWGMKMEMLYQVQAASNTTSMNYLSRYSGERHGQIQDNIARSTAAINDYSQRASDTLQQLAALKRVFEFSQLRYHGARAEKLSVDRSDTVELMDLIGSRMDYLGQQGDLNSQGHADLLGQVQSVLKDRVAIIDRHLGKLGAVDTFPNPLYVPPGLGATENTSQVTETYRTIVRQFIANTEKKVNAARSIQLALAEVQRSVEQELVFLQTLISNAPGLGPAAIREMGESARDSVHDFLSYLQHVQAGLDTISSMAEDLDFRRPDLIMGSRHESSRIFRLNREIEQFVLKVDDVEEFSLLTDARLMLLMVDVDWESMERLEPYGMLEKASSDRGKAIALFSTKFEELKTLASADVVLADDLKRLGMEISRLGHSMFEESLPLLSRALDRKKAERSETVVAFFNGAYEDIESRFQTLDQLLTLSDAIDDELFEAQIACIDCPTFELVWDEMAMANASFIDNIGQLDNLPQIEALFTGEEKTTSAYADSMDLFALNRLLGNEPYLHLNPDSIDVVFTAGSRMVAVKGIGDPGSSNLYGAASAVDYLKQPPYIGSDQSGWLSSIRSRSRGVYDNWIAPAGRSMYNTAGDVVSTVREVGGTIATTAGSYAARGFEAVRFELEVAGRALGMGLADWARNSWANLSWTDTIIYSASAVACGVAALKTMGAALIACKGILAKAKVDAIATGIKGYWDTLKQYDWISKETSEWLKWGTDWGKFIYGGLDNIKNTKNWASKTALEKFMIFNGLAPGNVTRFVDALRSGGLSRIKDTAKRAVVLALRLKESFEAGKDLFEFMGERIKNLQSLRDFLGGLDPAVLRGPLFPHNSPWLHMPFPYGTGPITPQTIQILRDGAAGLSDWLGQNLPGLGQGVIPGLGDYYVKTPGFWYNPFSLFNSPFSPFIVPALPFSLPGGGGILDSASGLVLPGSQPQSGADSPGVSLIPETAPDPYRTAPDAGRTEPDAGRIAPDPYRTAPDPYRTAPDAFRRR